MADHATHTQATALESVAVAANSAMVVCGVTVAGSAVPVGDTWVGDSTSLSGVTSVAVGAGGVTRVGVTVGMMASASPLGVHKEMSSKLMVRLGSLKVLAKKPKLPSVMVSSSTSATRC